MRSCMVFMTTRAFSFLASGEVLSLRGAPAALLLQVLVDQREAGAPGQRRAQRGVDDLVAGHGDDTRRERGDAGDEAVVTAGMIAKHRQSSVRRAVPRTRGPG